MDSTVFDYLNLSALTYNCPKEDWEIPSLESDDFHWIEDCLLDSILPSENLDFLSEELFNDNKDINLENDLENAKDDFNRVLEQWKLHVGETQGLPLNCKLDNGALESKILDVPTKGASNSNRDTHDGIPPLGQSPVLEAMDVDSLLEQFEASERNTNPVQKSCIETVVPSVTPEWSMGPETTLAQEFQETKETSSSISDKAINNNATQSQENGTHKLPIAQLPRFSIILKRGPISSPSENCNQEVWREHDYCSSPKLTVLPSANNRLAAEQSFSSGFNFVTSKTMKSVLKPVAASKNDDGASQGIVYSKLPDYYTSIVPLQSTEDTSDPVSVPKCSKVLSDEENEDGKYYSRLPFYLTTFVNTASGAASTELVNTPAKKMGDIGSAKLYSVIDKKETVLSAAAAVAKLNARKNVGPLKECKIATSGGAGQPRKRCHWYQQKSMTSCSRQNTSQSSLMKKLQNKAQHLSRERNIRPNSSRSPSHSGSSRSQSRSRSRSSERSSSSSSSSSYGSRKRSPSPLISHGPQRCFQSRIPQQNFHRKTRSYEKPKWEYKQYKEDEQKKQIEDRRVVHVGNIKPGTSRADLHRRFNVFGPIEDITIHFREHGDCFGFITFAYTVDAFEALEHGNDEGFNPKYELSLGGRRLFCLEHYSDLDSLNNNCRMYTPSLRDGGSFNFDELLKDAKKSLKNVSH